MPGWDNTARRGTTANIFVNGSPQAYEVWLRGIVDATKRDLPAGERFLFVNAWNEWAEGAHLEPDLKFGRAYLEATRRALTGTSDWQTIVDYASRRGELSGAVLTDWLRDVGAVLKRQELSCQHLLRSQQSG
jgi:lipopolysaccharide biosynthesis protein